MTLRNLSELVRFATDVGYTDGRPNLNLRFTGYKVEQVNGTTSFGNSSVANQWSSFWTFNGNPGHGSSPGTIANPNRTTSGTIAIPALIGNAFHLTHFGAALSTGGELVLYDRLAHMSGVAGTYTTLFSLIGFDPVRYTGVASDDLEVWVEIYSQIGATAATFNFAYYDQSLALQVVSVTIGGTGLREAQRMVKIPISRVGNGYLIGVAGQLLTSTGTAGDFGVTLLKPLARIEIATGTVYGYRSFTRGLDQGVTIEDGACLGLMFRPNGSGTTLRGSFQLNIIEDQGG